MKTLYLVDAYAMIFRAYYALMKNPRMTTTGKNTNAQFGFTNTLIDLIKNKNPTHLAVCFDKGAPTGRLETFADYKANRDETPEDIKLAVPDIYRIVEALNIPAMEVPGYEADDVIGTLAKQAAAQGYKVFMVTPDKDFGQLVSEQIFMYRPPYQGNAFEVMGPKEVCEKWEIERVDQVIDILALMGDAVDNIPGIRGVGEKTAAKLLKEYGSVENVLVNADNIKGALGEKIRAGKEAAIMSKKLATIITDAPCEFHEESFELSEWNKEKLIEIFTELEFKTLGKRLLGEQFPGGSSGGQVDLFGNNVPQAPKESAQKVVRSEAPTHEMIKTIEDVPHQYTLVQGSEAIENLIIKLSSEKEISFDTETTGLDANQCELVGLSFCAKKGEAFYIPCPADKAETNKILAQCKPLFDDAGKKWIGQNLKYDLLVLKNYGVEIAGELFDTMLAHFVIEPEGKRSMDILSEKYLGYAPVSIETLIGKKGKGQGNMRDVELEKIKEYAAEDADVTLQLKEIFLPELKKNEVEKVFYEVDAPLVKVLMDMEYQGININESFLNEYSKELEKDIQIAEESVYQQAGVRFNLASPKQLGEVLFEKLLLDPKAKKTKTGQYATGEDILEKLSHQHKICKDILVFRELSKLKSTYVDTLPELVNPKTGRVHTTFGQAVAVTGRLASNNPNLQNIPIRTDRGREVRKAFIPRDDQHLLMSADYSQIELRIVAAISGDPAMCEAFKAGKDIHTATASKVYNVPESEVTKEMRYKAKSVNFGIIYGQGAFGLADNLGISRTEAKEIIDNYKKEFSYITKYMDDSINFAREHGYVETLMGRKRWLRDINSTNFTVRGFAERNAINSPIQGSAADMIKLAMIKVFKEMRKANVKSKMILQVHDELVFDVLKGEEELMKEIVLQSMQTAMPLPNEVPTIAEVGMGENWLLAH